MAQQFVGSLVGQGLKVAIVASRFNGFITDQLVAGAKDGLARHGVAADAVDLAWVPGAFELPLAAKRLASTKKYDAVICVGAVIQGATQHFELVAGQTAAGLARASLDTGVPVIFGVLTTSTIEQAIERSGTKLGNKGFEAAATAIEMANLMRAMPEGAR